MIFVKSFTPAHFPKYGNLPEKKRVNRDISDLKYEILAFVLIEFNYYPNIHIYMPNLFNKFCLNSCNLPKQNSIISIELWNFTQV